jgi:hypothetical protein
MRTRDEKKATISAELPRLVGAGMKRVRERFRARSSAVETSASLRCSGQSVTIDRQLKERLNWLESAVGSRGLHKFLGGKLDVRGRLGGHYVSAYTGGDEEMQTLLIRLIDMLSRQEIAPICDVEAYYAAGKTWPSGMRIEGNRLIDCWARHK